MASTPNTRREFLARMAQGAAAAATGGLLWGYLLRTQAHASPFALRPPGALPEEDFLSLCIKCGRCATACPYDTLKMASAAEPVPIGTPYFVPQEIPCYMCKDIPCVPVCPTGALDHALTDIAQARMGLAVIDQESCLSYQGLRCEICFRVCPVQYKAITIELHPRHLSKHTLFIPIVHSAACTGCGLCEKACPTAEPAIRIVDPKLVAGRIGDHYRLGWTVDTPITQEFKPYEGKPVTGEPGRGVPAGPGGLDYLNSGELK